MIIVLKLKFISENKMKKKEHRKEYKNNYLRIHCNQLVYLIVNGQYIATLASYTLNTDVDF